MTQAYNTSEVFDYNLVQQPTVVFNQGMSLRDIEKSAILETLRHQNFNRTRTAKVLGIGIRTLQRKLKQYREAETHTLIELNS
ncbi:MAG: helix-turn-helix domain-containing protein [Oligoflexales bacterium]